MLDIDRDRQRISLGLKQTQEDPWQRVVDTYHVGDELEGTVTKVVAFGAFVEILEGVEGLVHISELAQQHVENPREIVQPGDEVKVKILEIDSERRRLSLSIKRVEGQVLERRSVADAGDLENVPELGLSEDVFAAQGPTTSPSPRRSSPSSRRRTKRRSRPSPSRPPRPRRSRPSRPRPSRPPRPTTRPSPSRPPRPTTSRPRRPSPSPPLRRSAEAPAADAPSEDEQTT